MLDLARDPRPGSTPLVRVLNVALARSAGLRWAVRVFTLIVLVVDARLLGLDWPTTLVVAPVAVYVLVRIGVRIGFRLAVRRGLLLPEWLAVAGMATMARRGIKTNFDSVALTRCQDPDDAVVTGYGAILLNLLIARHVSTRPTNEQVAQLVDRLAPRWTHVTSRRRAELDRLLRAACRYEIDGIPAPSWDNARGLAAIAGLLGSTADRRSLRVAVATRYQNTVAHQAAH